MLTKGAIGNLVNRYRAVLKKCHIMNTFGSLAVAAMLVMGSAGMASAAEDIIMTGTLQKVTIDADGNKTYGDVTATGDIIVFDETKPAGEQAFDIEVGNLTAGGVIKAGEITTQGNLTADHVETFKNTDMTLTNNAGSVTVYGAVNLPGDSTTSRRFDIYNTEGAHNVIGSVHTGACIGLAGNGEEKSTLEGGLLAVGGGSFTVVNGMQATIDEVTFNIDGRKARVHSDAGTKVDTILDLNKFVMHNGHFIADASWDSGYAMGVIRNVSADEARPGVLIGDGHIVVGSNAMVALGEGATVNGLYDLMKTHTGYEAPTQDGVKAALALYSPLEIQDGFRVYMDGDKRTEELTAPYKTGSEAQSSLLDAMSAAGTFTQTADTLLAINGAAAQAAGAITYAGSAEADATIEDGAKLLVMGAQAGETYVVLGDGFGTITLGDTAWTGENLLSDNPLVSLNRGDDGTVAGEAVAAAEALPGLDSGVASILDSANLAHEIGTGDQFDAGSKGAQFLSRALKWYADEAQKTAEQPALARALRAAPAAAGNPAAAVDTINEVSRAAVTAGVQNTGLRIADAASNTVLDHMSLAGHNASMHADGVDFWVAPMYGNLYTSGMVSSGSSVRGQFAGLALGADLEAGQFLGGKFRVGAAINGGGGQSETKGTATVTENDYDFGGINFYAGWNKDALNVIASVGYGFGNHEVEMGLPSILGMGKADADIDTTAFTADLRAEYQLSTAFVDVLPHVGVRYTALKTDAHDLKADGGVLNSVASNTQNIVQFPIGVTLSKNIAFADWNVKPMVDVSFIPAAGDKEADTKVNFSGTSAWGTVNSRIMDSTSWAGIVGIQAEKGSFSLGLNYGVQASSHETDQNVQIKLGWKF